MFIFNNKAKAQNYDEALYKFKDALIVKYEVKKYVDNLGRYLLQRTGGAREPILWMASGYRVYRDRRVELHWGGKTFEMYPNKIKLEYTFPIDWK
jgi:hypothetical protein